MGARSDLESLGRESTLRLCRRLQRTADRPRASAPSTPRRAAARHFPRSRSSLATVGGTRAGLGEVPIHDWTSTSVEEAGPDYQLCAGALMIFDVAFENEIAHAAARAKFFRGSQLCAYGSAVPGPGSAVH